MGKIPALQNILHLCVLSPLVVKHSTSLHPHSFVPNRAAMTSRLRSLKHYMEFNWELMVHSVDKVKMKENTAVE